MNAAAFLYQDNDRQNAGKEGVKSQVLIEKNDVKNALRSSHASSQQHRVYVTGLRGALM